MRKRSLHLAGFYGARSTPQLLANTDAFWYGITRSQEVMNDCYAHLPLFIRSALHRLAQGKCILEAEHLLNHSAFICPIPRGSLVMKGKCWSIGGIHSGNTIGAGYEVHREPTHISEPPVKLLFARVETY